MKRFSIALPVAALASFWFSSPPRRGELEFARTERCAALVG